MIPDFSNTQQAYSHLSDGELRKAVWLFRLVGRASWVRAGKGLLAVARAMHLPVGWAIKPTIYAHFCGGETIEEAEQTVEKLASRGVKTILDYSAEGKDAEGDLDAARDEVLAAIRAAQGDARHGFSVFKVSGVASTRLLEQVSLAGEALVGLTAEERAAWSRVQQRVTDLCDAAASAGTRIFIDAEESWLQPAIDGLAEAQMARLNRGRIVVFTTVQLYRHDRLEYLRTLTHQAIAEGFQVGVKLVRGAYMEKERARAAAAGLPSPIQPDKASTDRDYDDACAWCLQHRDHIAFCAGSHNEESQLRLCAGMEEAGVAAGDERVWFAQLLGMSDPISFNLAAHGYNVAKYVPYGPMHEAIPYLIRRAEENTSVAGQTSRELDRLRHEQRRRAQARA
ncbi:MAG: hypothetical protein RJA19_519 [Bacteroidota bacterium]